MQRKVSVLEKRAEQLQEEIARLEEKRESVKAEIVRYEAAPGTSLIPIKHVRRLRRGSSPSSTVSVRPALVGADDAPVSASRMLSTATPSTTAIALR